MSQPRPQTMNAKRVVLWMTIGVSGILLMMTFVLLGALPPWPVWLFFAISHGFFCAVILKTRPYPGPHVTPLFDPNAGRGSGQNSRTP